jgi:Na+/proline symporter
MSLPQTLTAEWMIGILVVYFLLLIAVGWWVNRGTKDDNDNFFSAGRKSPWYLVAIGMIGASISGVTFISIPGWVGDRQFSYLQTVLGYTIGYTVIATVLMPLYYRLGLVSIYAYLKDRFGIVAYKTGATAFLISRTLGTALRLYLMALVLYKFILGPFGLPFPLVVTITVFLIWVYTYRGGVKTIIYTDALQTICLLGSLVLSVYFLTKGMDSSMFEVVRRVADSQYSQALFFDAGWSDVRNFFKQVIGGALICIVMSGLDQDIMQKNLTCKNIGDAQKNMFWFTQMLVIANILFVFLGALLFLYAKDSGMALPLDDAGKFRSDYLFPTIALQHQPFIVGVLFLLGITASTYASSDSALTSLTTVFCLDFLNFEERERKGIPTKTLRTLVHLGFSVLLCLLCIVVYYLNDAAVIKTIFKIASYTYGPLLGLFAFGLMTRRQIKDPLSAIICIAAPIICYILDKNSVAWLGGYKFDFEILLLNGILVFIGLWMISTAPEREFELDID